jgi:hypothetical protein
VDAFAGRHLEATAELVGIVAVEPVVAGDDQRVVARERVVRAVRSVVQPWRGLAVVEARRDVHVELDLAFDALDHADKLAQR